MILAGVTMTAGINDESWGMSDLKVYTMTEGKKKRKRKKEKEKKKKKKKERKKKRNNKKTSWFSFFSFLLLKLSFKSIIIYKNTQYYLDFFKEIQDVAGRRVKSSLNLYILFC